MAERPTREAAYEAATRSYLAGRRVDMRELAADIGVARNTLYRWTGGREQLLQDVIWALSESVIDDIWTATSRRRGTSRLVEALRRYLVTIVDSTALQAFLRNETYVALRLLTSHGPFQDRLVAKVRTLVDEEAARGTFTPRADTELLAYAAVRTLEGFVYNDTVVRSEPEVDRAVKVIRLLLE
ncbi:MAG TPA: QsdR family transcriptional regulator [Marmoricola sp.]|nr:QsdR family transcriptional regulator [Marmoricola sp.]